jgi:hypothetical protein
LAISTGHQPVPVEHGERDPYRRLRVGGVVPQQHAEVEGRPGEGVAGRDLGRRGGIVGGARAVGLGFGHRAASRVPGSFVGLLGLFGWATHAI